LGHQSFIPIHLQLGGSVRSLLLSAALLVTVFATQARADWVDFYGDEGGNHFTGRATLTGDQLNIALNNSSVADTLTAIYFNSAQTDVTLDPTAPYGTAGSFGGYEFSVTGLSIAAGSSASLDFTVKVADGNTVPASAWNFFTDGGTLAAGEPLVAQFGDSFVGDVPIIPAPLPATASCGVALFAAFGIGRSVRRRRAAK
jgi:hypothetical protein